MATTYKAWLKGKDSDLSAYNGRSTIYYDGITPDKDAQISLVSSYIGDALDSFLYRELELRPKYVAMLNDYCDDIVTSSKEKEAIKLIPSNIEEDFMTIYYQAPKLLSKTYNILNVPYPDVMRVIDDKNRTVRKAMLQLKNNKGKLITDCDYDITNGYLLNHTRNCYIDLALYIKKAKEYSLQKTGNPNPKIISPLQHLTAIGMEDMNKELGYNKKFINYNRYGSWAFDYLSFTKDKDFVRYMYLEDILFSYYV